MATPISSTANSGNSATSTAVAITLPTYTPSVAFEQIFLFVSSSVSSTIPTPTGWSVVTAKFGTTPCAALFAKWLDVGGADSAASVTLTLGTAGSWTAVAYIPTPGVASIADVSVTKNGSTASTSGSFTAVTPNYGTTQSAFGIEFFSGQPTSGQTDTLTVPTGYGNSATTATAKPTSVNTSTGVWSVTTATYTGGSSYTAPTVTQSSSDKYVNIFVSITPPIQSATAAYAAYNFDEGSGLTAADATGGGSTLTIRNTSASWNGSGHTNSALAAGTSGPDASSSTFTVPTGSISISFWWKYSGIAGFFDFPIELLDSASAHVTFGLRMRQDQSNTSFDYEFCDSGANDLFGSILTLPINTWAHLCFTYVNVAPFSSPVYVNGSSVGTPLPVTSASLNGSGTSTNLLKMAVPASGSTLASIIDDLRFYNLKVVPANILYDMITPVSSGTTPAPKQAPAIVNRAALIRASVF